MLRYELQKIFGRSTGRLALLVLAIGLAVICYSGVLHVEYVDANGDSHTGPAAARQLRDLKNEWAGPIDADALSRAIAANQAVQASDDYNSDDIQRQNAAYHHTQGYDTIRSLVASTFGGFNDYDYYLLDRLDATEASQLYERRVENLEAWFEKEEIGFGFTQAERDYLIGQYEAMETPLVYEYNDGWETVLYYAPTLNLFLILLIVFLVSGIFPCERRWRADAVFFSTRLGRSRATRTKMLAGLTTVTVLYWLSIALYTGVLLFCLGADGAGGAIQLLQWKSFYNLTIGQTYVIAVLGGYLAVLFFALMAMFASTLSGSQVVGVIVPYVLLLASSMLNSLLTGSDSLPAIIGLMPDQLVQLYQLTNDFYLYTIGGQITGSIPVLFVLYSLLVLLLIPLTILRYRRSEVR